MDQIIKMPKEKIISKNKEERKKKPKNEKAIFQSDARETNTLIKAGRVGAANAIRASRALGLPITYMENNILYKEYPDGKREKIEQKDKVKPIPKKTNTSLKKGMVLHARK